MDEFTINPALLGATTEEEEIIDPTALAGLGLGAGYVASQTGGLPSASGQLSPFAQKVAAQDAARLGARNMPNLIGQPTTTAPQLIGTGTQTYTGPQPTARPMPGTQVALPNQPPAVQPGGSPATGGMKPANVTGVRTVNPAQIATKASAFSRVKPTPNLGLLAYTLADAGVEAATGEGISQRIGEPLGELAGGMIYGDGSQPALTQEELDQIKIGVNPATGTQVISLPPIDRTSDPVRATYVLPDGTMQYERESGEKFTPTAEQLEAQRQIQESVLANQPTAVGLGQGGDAGVTFGGGQGPRSVSDLIGYNPDYAGQNIADYTGYNTTPETRTEQFVDAQGRLRRRDAGTKELTSQYQSYEKEAQNRLDRLNARPDFNRAISDRERRGAGDISQADYNDMAKGMARGASPSERGRALKIANELGVDPETGGKLKEPFEPKEVEISGKNYIQLSPTYYQPVTEEPEPFTPQVVDVGGVQYVETSEGNFRPLPKEPKDPNSKDDSLIIPDNSSASNERIAFETMEEAEAANLPAGTKITIGGRNATT